MSVENVLICAKARGIPYQRFIREALERAVAEEIAADMAVRKTGGQELAPREMLELALRAPQ